ncbi:MAG TPA: hemerythrin domain-containing protein [Xanthobacteraceae bacterium]|nr:hemerythrin domain-containing protein [Xanthobacteraceae bacterium]
MEQEFEGTRRGFAQVAGAAGLVALGGLWTPAGAAERKTQNKTQNKAQNKTQKAKTSGNAQEEEQPPVTPPEDLMREHGVLDRTLLIYDAALRKFDANEEFDPAAITQSAQVIRDFIENYHEKSEEQQVFPRFQKANQMVELVQVLLAQHQAGRKVTATILRLAPNSRAPEARGELVRSMRDFIAMYRPHAAREDTELFPKLRKVVSPNEFDAMAEDFEREEHRLFGEDGFEKMVDRVAQIERMVGINDLSKFTPS